MLQNRSNSVSQPDGGDLKPNWRGWLPKAVPTTKFFPFLILIAVVLVYERAAPPDLKLSAIFGRFEGNTESEALRAQVDGLSVRLAAEKAAEEKMQNAIATYKFDLEVQLEAYKNQLSVAGQKAVDTNRLNLERRNRMTEALLVPVTKAMETKYQMAAVGMGSSEGITQYATLTQDIIRMVTLQVQQSLAAVEAHEANPVAAEPPAETKPAGRPPSKK
jgi:hypothetical protein